MPYKPDISSNIMRHCRHLLTAILLTGSLLCPVSAAVRSYEHSATLSMQASQSLEEAQQQAQLKARYELLNQIAQQLQSFPPVQQHKLSQADLVAVILSVSQFEAQTVQAVVKDNQVMMQARLKLSFELEKLANILQNPYHYQDLIEQYRQLAAKENQQMGLIAELNQSLSAEPTPARIKTNENLRQNLQINQQAMQWYQKGLLAMQQREYARAQTAFSNALTFDAGFAEAYLGRGNSLRGLGNRAGALQDLQMAIQLKPGLVGAYINRAALFSGNGEHARAIGEFNQLIARSQDPIILSSVYFGRGLSHYLTQQLDQALADYNLAINLDPGHAELPLMNRAGLLLQLGKPAQAMEDYQQIIKLSPDWADIGHVYFSLGNLLSAQAHHQQAMEAFQMAENKGLESAELFYKKGLAHLKLSQALPAVQALSKAITLQNTEQGAYYLARAEAYTLLGNCHLAQQDYKKACSLSQVSACSAKCSY